MDGGDVDLTPNEQLATLRELLAATGYATQLVCALAQIGDPENDVLANMGRYSFFFNENLAQLDSPAAVLAQLFMFGRRITPQRFGQLSGRIRELLQMRRFVASEGGEIKPRLAITEVQGKYFLSDLLFEYVGDTFVPLPAPCMPPHASSLELAEAVAPLPPAASLLDVGCGSGVMSILFADRYERLVGLDLDPRSVSFARANAALNRVNVTYSVADCTRYSDGHVYEHVSVNIPAEVTIAFLETGLDPVLAQGGLCRMWASFEVKASERSLRGLFASRLDTYSRWVFEIEERPQSPFALSPEQLQRGLMPKRTLLVDHTSKWPAYIQRLKAQGIAEVVTAVMTLTRE